MSRLVWITGAGGLIGNYLVQTAPRFAPNFQTVSLTRDKLDLTDFSAVRREFQKDKPQLIIHCAALSKSPECQKNPALAYQLNVEVTQNLADLAADIPFIYFSTDLVFDGQKGNYVETDAPNPLSIYAETKVAAEKIVLTNPKHTIIRTSLNGGVSPTGDRGFNEELRRGWQEGKEMRLFTDEFRAPIPAIVTARAIWELAAQHETGIFHIAGSKRMSRYEIAKTVAARWPELNPKIEPSSIAEYTGAPRPPDTSLNCEKIQKLLSFPLRGLAEWLQKNPTEIF